MNRVFIYNQVVYAVSDDGSYVAYESFPEGADIVTTCLDYGFASRLIVCPGDYKKELLLYSAESEDFDVRETLPQLRSLLSVRDNDDGELNLFGLIKILDDYASSDVFPDGTQILADDENIESYSFRFELVRKGILLSYLKKDLFVSFPVKPFYIETITRTLARSLADELENLKTAIILFIDANFCALAVWSEGEVLIEFSEKLQEKQFNAEYFAGITEDLIELAKLEINKLKLPSYQKVFLVAADEIRVLLSQKQYMLNKLCRIVDLPLLNLIGKGLAHLYDEKLKRLNLAVNDLEVYALYKKAQEIRRQKSEQLQTVVNIIKASSPILIAIITSILTYIMTWGYEFYLDNQIAELKTKTSELPNVRTNLTTIEESLLWYKDWFKQVNLVQNNKDITLFFLREIDSSASSDVLFRRIDLLKTGSFNVKAEGLKESNVVSFLENVENNTLISDKEKMSLNVRKESPKEKKVSLEIKGIYPVLEVEESKTK